MSYDPSRIIVTKGGCHSCSTHTFRAHHHVFPEKQVEGESAEQAVVLLAERLRADLDCVADPSHREVVHGAISDAREFLSKTHDELSTRDLVAPTTR